MTNKAERANKTLSIRVGRSKTKKPKEGTGGASVGRTPSAAGKRTSFIANGKRRSAIMPGVERRASAVAKRRLSRAVPAQALPAVPADPEPAVEERTKDTKDTKEKRPGFFRRLTLRLRSVSSPARPDPALIAAAAASHPLPAVPPLPKSVAVQQPADATVPDREPDSGIPSPSSSSVKKIPPTTTILQPSFTFPGTDKSETLLPAVSDGLAAPPPSSRPRARSQSPARTPPSPSLISTQPASSGPPQKAPPPPLSAFVFPRPSAESQPTLSPPTSPSEWSELRKSAIFPLRASSDVPSKLNKEDEPSKSGVTLSPPSPSEWAELRKSTVFPAKTLSPSPSRTSTSQPEETPNVPTGTVSQPLTPTAPKDKAADRVSLLPAPIEVSPVVTKKRKSAVLHVRAPTPTAALLLNSAIRSAPATKTTFTVPPPPTVQEPVSFSPLNDDLMGGNDEEGTKLDMSFPPLPPSPMVSSTPAVLVVTDDTDTEPGVSSPAEVLVPASVSESTVLLASPPTAAVAERPSEELDPASALPEPLPASAPISRSSSTEKVNQWLAHSSPSSVNGDREAQEDRPPPSRASSEELDVEMPPPPSPNAMATFTFPSRVPSTISVVNLPPADPISPSSASYLEPPPLSPSLSLTTSGTPSLTSSTSHATALNAPGGGTAKKFKLDFTSAGDDGEDDELESDETGPNRAVALQESASAPVFGPSNAQPTFSFGIESDSPRSSHEFVLPSSEEIRAKEKEREERLAAPRAAAAGQTPTRSKTLSLFSRRKNANSPESGLTLAAPMPSKRSSFFNAFRSSTLGPLSPRSPSPMPPSPRTPPLPPRSPLSPTMHTPSTLAQNVGAIKDDESRRLTESAFIL